MFETLIHAAIEKLTSNALILVLTGLTITTSGVAGTKLYTNYSQGSQPAALQLVDQNQVNGTTPENAESDQESLENESSEQNQAAQTTPTPTAVAKLAQVFPSASPTSTGNTTQSAGQSSATAASCIITVNNKNYDVQTLRSTHPGGDIFVCDTDMTAKFNAQHGTNYSMLSAYATTAATGSSSTGTTAGSGNSTGSSSTLSSTSVKSLEHEEEREDDEYEEEDQNKYQESEREDD